MPDPRDPYDPAEAAVGHVVTYRCVGEQPYRGTVLSFWGLGGDYWWSLQVRIACKLVTLNVNLSHVIWWSQEGTEIAAPEVS